MKIFALHTLQDLLANGFVFGNLIQKSRKDIQVGELHNKAIGTDRQTFCSEEKNFTNGAVIKITNALEASLHDLFEGIGPSSDTINIFVVADLLYRAFDILSILYNGECHVRFQRHQSAIRIGKSENMV